MRSKKYFHFLNVLIFLANFLKLLYHLKCNFDRLRSDQQGTKSPKSERTIELTFVGVPEFREFLLCPGATSTKSKKTDSDSVLLDSRNTNARALATGGGLEVQTKNPNFIDILIGKRIRHRRIAMGLSQKE